MQIVQISVKFHIFNVPAFPVPTKKKGKPININLMFQYSDGMIEIVILYTNWTNPNYKPLR